MMNILQITAALVVLAVAGCAAEPKLTGDTSAKDSDVRFSCMNGETVSVRFFPAQGVAVLVRNGNNIELQQQPTGSGFLYSNGPNTIRGKGDELMLEIGRMVPVPCKAR